MILKASVEGARNIVRGRSRFDRPALVLDRYFDRSLHAIAARFCPQSASPQEGRFAGIRILNVKLTGPMNKKEVIVQPAYVVDNAVITDAGSGPSYFVYQPVTLVR